MYVGFPSFKETLSKIQTIKETIIDDPNNGYNGRNAIAAMFFSEAA